MSTPEPADPWADPAWRPELAPPVSDGLTRAIGDYCAAENAKAKAVCAECPARDACLGWALEHSEYGIWGGLTEDERRALLRQRRAS